MKQSILDNHENKAESNRKMLEMKNQHLEERRKENKAMDDHRRSMQRKAVEEKSRRAKEEADRLAEQKAAASATKIAEKKAERDRYEEDLRKKQNEDRNTGNQEFLDKMQKIKERGDGVVNDKAKKTLRELESKEELSRQEKKKVQDAIDRRRQLKAIKQEAFEINAMRTKKQKKHKMDKLERDIRNKDMRCNAIKKGFQVLGQMRNSMKDIVNVTQSLMKEEMHKLRHTDSFEPDKVIERALKVSEEILFPRLEHTFGTKPMVEQNVFSKSEDLFKFDFKSDDFAQSAEAFLDDGTNDKHANVQKETSKATTKEIDPSITEIQRPNSVLPRSNFATLAVEQINKDALLKSLVASCEKSKLEIDSKGASPGKHSPSNQSPMGKSPAHTKPKKKSPSKSQMDADLELIRKHQPAILDIGEGTGNPHSPDLRQVSTASVNSRASSRIDRANKETDHLGRSIGEPDIPGVDIPIFPFNPNSEEAMAEEAAKAEELRKSDAAAAAKKKQFAPSTKTPMMRTDQNEKAKFLTPPVGKFRREFSTDHPLAAKGTGKYKDEAKKGLVPTGLPDDVVTTYGNVKTAVDTANKVEKLTYAAQNRNIDPTLEVEVLRQQQNETLKQIIAEEQAAEEERQRIKKEIENGEERQRLDLVFTEERRRANQRIINATKEHEATIKEAVLRTMNLAPTKTTINSIGK